jgi:hypothetical protein
MRLKEQAHDDGHRQGRMEAAAMYERRLEKIERMVQVMWDAFCRDETRVIERPDDKEG